MTTCGRIGNTERDNRPFLPLCNNYASNASAPLTEQRRRIYTVACGQIIAASVATNGERACAPGALGGKTSTVIWPSPKVEM